MTTTSIFIKTWARDLPWMEYCLQSIRKYASGINEVVIVVDALCADRVREMAQSETVVAIPEWKNGYIHQQWLKLCADRFTSSDQILFVDSDCVFYAPFTPQAFMRGGKPILLKTKYSELGNSPVAVVAQKWKRLTENIINRPVDSEYMRRCPLMFLSSTLQCVRAKFPALEEYMRSIEDSGFSEFNLLGAVVEHDEPNNYTVIDTVSELPVCPATQFWSWGGITPETQSVIDGYLKA